MGKKQIYLPQNDKLCSMRPFTSENRMLLRTKYGWCWINY